MAKTVQQETGSQKLALKTKHSKTLEELREKRQSLGKDLYEGLERTEEIYRSMDEAGLKEVDKNLGKLDSGLNRCNEFNQTIAELASGLTGELTSLRPRAKTTRALKNSFRFFQRTRPTACG